MNDWQELPLIGSVPFDWSWAYLGEVIAFSQYGINAASAVDARYPMLRMNNLKDGRIDNSDLVHVDLSDEEYSAYKLELDDLLINRTNSYELVGKTSLFELEGDYVFASYLIRFRFNLDVVFPKFVHYFLNSKVGKGLLKSFATKGVSQANLNPTTLKKKLPIPLPPLPEQRKIAAILSTWDEAITLTSALIAALQRRKQALMQLLLTGQVRFEEFIRSDEVQETELGNIPADWWISRFGEVFKMSSGSTPTRTRPDYFQGDILWVTSGELNYSQIYDTIEKITQEAANDTNLKIFPIGTFLLAITGLEAEGTRGRCGILGKPATVNQSCMAFEQSEHVNTIYLFYFYLLFGETIAFNFAQGTKQQSLPRRILSLVPICYPVNLEEQKEIASLLETCEQEISILSQKLSEVKTQKRGLMQQLLTGAVRVEVKE